MQINEMGIAPVNSLKSRSTNIRTHKKKKIQQIADSIRELCLANPVLVDGQNRIITGHGRVEAVKTFRITEVSTVGSTVRERSA